MAILGERQFVERLRFFNGQRLFASDLQAIDTFHQQMRWLHNQSLHQPGVGRGFAVSAKKGEKVVKVQEGYAIDADGREIVLTFPHTEVVPPVAGVDGRPIIFDLVVSYPADDDLVISEERQGICSSAGAVRRREEPVFCWVEIGADGQPTDDRLKQRMAAADIIRLARAKILDCKLYADISIAERRNARPPQQPYIACGQYLPKWKLTANAMPTDLSSVRSLGFLSGNVPTNSAGFRTQPCYFIEILGSRVFDRPGFDTLLVDGVPTVSASDATSVTVNVDVLGQRLGPATAGGPGTIDEKFFEDWVVTWIGVEG